MSFSKDSSTLARRLISWRCEGVAAERARTSPTASWKAGLAPSLLAEVARGDDGLWENTFLCKEALGDYSMQKGLGILQ